MSWKEKWKDLSKKQEVDDIEFCRNHPRIWKGTMMAFIMGYSTLFVLCILYGAIPIAIITLGFSIYILREMRNRYRNAFPKKVII